MEKTRVKIPIMHCFDNYYVIPAAVSFFSMLQHADNQYDYLLYVLHTDITMQNQEILREVVGRFSNASLEFIDMSNRFEELWKELRFSGHFSKEVLYKLIMPSIFPQFERIITTDVDVVFLGDIAPSYFSLDDSDALWAGVRQISPDHGWLKGYYQNYESVVGIGSSGHLKICGGYLVANLKQQRLRKMEKNYINYLQKNVKYLLQSEQDVINFCIQEEDIVYLPLSNVLCSYVFDVYDRAEAIEHDRFYRSEEIVEAMNSPIQLHFATGIKPWNAPSCTKAEIWYEYLVKTGLILDFVRRFMFLSLPAMDQIYSSQREINRPLSSFPYAVSVLCCTHNHAETLEKTLLAIFRQQTFFCFDVILSDDASTDGTQEIIRSFQSEYANRMHVIFHEESVGIGQNYREALSHVKGKYLAVCDCNAVWIDVHKLQHQVNLLEARQDAMLCCSSYIVGGKNGGENERASIGEYIAQALGEKNACTFADLLCYDFVDVSTAMIRWQLHGQRLALIRGNTDAVFMLILIHAAYGCILVENDRIFAKYLGTAGKLPGWRHEGRDASTAFGQIKEVDQYLKYQMSRTIYEYFDWLKKRSNEEAQAATALEDQSEAISELTLVGEKPIGPRQRLKRLIARFLHR